MRFVQKKRDRKSNNIFFVEINDLNDLYDNGCKMDEYLNVTGNKKKKKMEFDFELIVGRQRTCAVFSGKIRIISNLCLVHEFEYANFETLAEIYIRSVILPLRTISPMSFEKHSTSFRIGSIF